MRTKRKAIDSRWRLLWIAGWLAAFHPNCARCCPDSGGCSSCKYAWEDCPPSSGCNACGSRSIPEAPFAEGGPGTNSLAIEAGASDDPPGGTIAFVDSPTGAFVLGAIPGRDVVHVVHLEATKWDEDPLTIRTFGDVAFASGDQPGRLVASHPGRAHVVLRGGSAIASVDPRAVAILERARVCAEPRGLAYDSRADVLHVACASGEIITSSAATSQEVKHQFVTTGLEDLTISGDAIVASTRTRIVRVGPDGTTSDVDPRGAIGALRGTGGGITLAVTNEKAAFATMTPEGTLGPWMAVRSEPSNLHESASDLDVALDGTVAIVAGGEAFVLSRGAPAFVPMGAPGIARAVAMGEIVTDGIRRRVIAVQTDEPRMLVFFGAGSPPAVLGIEPM